MKLIEQYDAHVQSYRNEQKRKERERIRQILQYLAQKRKQLTLARHPVSRIYYNVKMLNPAAIAPFSIKKISFESQVQSPTIQPVSDFKMPEYKLNVPDIPISIESFDDAFISHSFASTFSFSQQPLPNLETQKQSVLKQYDITPPILPDLSNAISPLQTNPIKHSQVSFKLDSSNISDLVAPLLIPYIYHTKIEYKAKIADVELSTLSKKTPIVDSQHIDTRITTINTKMEKISVPNCYQKFAIPAFDFSDTKEKLKRALIADRMQGE